MKWFWKFSGHIYSWTMRALSDVVSARRKLLISPSFCAALTLVAPHIKKSTKCMTKHIPIYIHDHHPSSKLPPNRHLGYHHNADDTTTAANEGIFAFPNAPGRGQPFLLLYLPFCMGEGPLSSVFCRPGALIVSRYCTGNNRQDDNHSYQCHFDGCKYVLLLKELKQKMLNT